MKNPYSKHSDFIAPARISGFLGQLVLGVFLIEMLHGFLLGILQNLLEFISHDFAASVFRGDNAVGLLTQLFSFSLFILSLVLIVRQRHKRGFFSLIGPPMTAIRQFWKVAPAVIMVVVAIEMLPPWWAVPEGAEFRPLILWVLLLPISILALLFQTGAEELFYRGYVQQQVAVLSNRPIVWLLVPNILFALAHFDNGTTEIESLQYMVWAFCFGLAASDLTGRTGTLGPAVAFHLVNNAYAFLFFGERGANDSGLALLLLPVVENGDAFLGGAYGSVFSPSLIIEIAVIAVMWLAARVALRC